MSDHDPGRTGAGTAVAAVRHHTRRRRGRPANRAGRHRAARRGAADDRVARHLRGPRRELVLRLNRLFWSDGDEGIARFEALRRSATQRTGCAPKCSCATTRRRAAAGDIDAWDAWVRRAVRRLARHPSVVAFSVTNEANFPVSPNTSDGAYRGVVEALVRGIAVAGEELRAMGRGGMPLGFNVAWRFTPDSDADFWQEIGAKATPAFRRALDFVGRPGVSGPRLAAGCTAGPLGRCGDHGRAGAPAASATCHWLGSASVRRHLGYGERVRHKPRPHGDDPVPGAGVDTRAVRAVLRRARVTDYRYFNLRDNNSTGTDLFAAVGLLRDDHSPKPAFAILRSAIAATGGPPLTARRPRQGARPLVSGTVPPPCRGRVRVGRKRVRVDRRCRFPRACGATGLSASATVVPSILV